MKNIFSIFFLLIFSAQLYAQSVNIIEGDTVRIRKRNGSTFLDVVGSIRVGTNNRQFVDTSAIKRWNTAYGWGDHHGLYLKLTGGTVTGPVYLTGGTNIDGVDPNIYLGDNSVGFSPRNGSSLYSISGKFYWGTQGGSDYLHSFYLDNSGLNAEQNYALPNKSGTIALLDDITKERVGLGNVDNTADVNKPLSGPQQTYVDNAINNLSNDVSGNYIPNTQKGAANGVATLDANQKLLPSQLPAVAITNTYVVNSESAMLALAAHQGDVCIRTDESKSYVLADNSPGNLSSWKQLLSPTQNLVQDVNGQPGPHVSLTTGNIPEGSNLYYTNSRVQTFSDTRYLQLTGGTITGSMQFNGASNNFSGTVSIAGSQPYLYMTNAPSPVVGGSGVSFQSISGNPTFTSSNGSNTKGVKFVTDNTTNLVSLTVPNKNGTIALTSDIPVVNPGGETLQSVMSRGASTTIGMTFATPNPAWDNGLDIVIGSKNNRSTIQSHNIANTSPQSLDINPYGGDVNIGSATAGTNGLIIYGGYNPSAYPTLGQFKGGLRLLNSDGLYGLDAGVNTDGNTWLQAGRSDGTATAYNLVLNPAGGNVLIGANSLTNEKVQIFTGGNRTGLAISGNSGGNITSDFSISRTSSNAGVGQSAAIQLNDNSTGGNHVILQAGSAGFQIYNSFGTGSWNEYMRIEPSGNILIGDVTAGGSNRLKVQTNQPAGTSVAYVNNTNTATNTYGLIVNTAATDAGSQIFSARSNSVDRFTIASNGYVGFGTVSPARQIEEWNNGAVEFLMTDASQPTDLKRWRMFNASQRLTFGTVNDALTNAVDILKLFRDGSVQIPALQGGNNAKFITTDGSGNLSLGTVPASSLQAVTNAGNTTSNAINITGFSNQGSSGMSLTYLGGAGAAAVITNRNAGADLSGIQFNSDGSIFFNSTNASANGAFQLYVPGNNGITGSFTGRVRGVDPVNSNEFATKNYVDNAVATTSGSWSPTLLSISNYDILNASYVRTGNVITIALTIRVNSSATTSAGTSNVYISGMPLFSKARIGSNTIVGKLTNTSSSTISAPFYETNYDSTNPNNIGLTLPTTTTPLTNNGLLGFGGTGDKILIFNMTYQIG